jgi:pimeloyl-ACP methyl ester carboxylesterase
VANAERLKTFERDWQRRFGQIAVAEGLLPADWTTRHGFESDRELARRYSWTDRDRTMAWRITFTAVNTYSGRNWRHMLGGMVYYNEDVAGAVLNDPEYGKAIKEVWPALKAFRGPVRVIIGTHDYVDLGPTFWPKLVTKIPNARLETIPNAGHSIWMDEPAAFTQSLRTALEETAVRSKSN